jgi:hypothetical protein
MPEIIAIGKNKAAVILPAIQFFGQHESYLRAQPQKPSRQPLASNTQTAGIIRRKLPAEHQNFQWRGIHPKNIDYQTGKNKGLAPS